MDTGVRARRLDTVNISRERCRLGLLGGAIYTIRPADDDPDVVPV
jgi:hypothetical protein